MGALFVFVTGIWAGLSLPVHPFWPLLAAWLFVAGACVGARGVGSIPLIWGALLSVAWVWAAMDVQPVAPRELGALMERPREHVEVRGRIVDDPIREHAPTGGDLIWRMTVRAEQINRIGHFQKTSGVMDVRWRSAAGTPVPTYGDVWSFTGVLQQRAHRDWRWAFLPSYRMRVSDEDATRLAVGRGTWLNRFSYAGRRAASERLGMGLEQHPDLAGILRALLLGYRHELPSDHHRLFALTGTLHIFAISGLHVGIVGGLLLIVVRAFGVSRERWILFVGPLLIIYTVATGMRPSAMRACAMTLAFFSAFLVNRKPDAPSALALAALVILSVSPTQLTSPGFIFSFVIVAGLIRLYPMLAGPAREWWTDDPYSATALPDSKLSFRQKGIRWFIGLAAASIAAWSSSVPLTSQYFNLFSPVGLIGNLLVIPAAFLIVLTGLLALICGTISEVGAEIFNHANRVTLTVLIAAVDGLAQIPGGHWHVRSPGIGWIAIWYGFIFGGLLLPDAKSRRIGFACLAVVAAIGIGWERADHSTRVRVLNAGDGHAVLIRTGGEYTLYDTGPAYRAERLVRALRAEGVNRLDRLILSHPSSPHAGGAAFILAAIPVGELWCTDFPSRSPAYDRALAVAEAEGVPITRVRAGMYGVWSNRTAWEILHPADPTAYRRAADASIVLRISRGAVATLLVGGGGAAVERDILHARRDPTAAVLVIGNQGTAGVASERWLEAVVPQAVILSVGAHNRHGYPDRDVIERIEKQPDMTLWRTDESGAVELVLSSRVRFGRRADTWRITGEWPEE